MLSTLSGALALLLRFALEIVNDKTLQHAVALLGVGYTIAHGFSAAFRHDVTVGEQKAKSFFGRLFHPVVLLFSAFRGAVSGFKSGLKGVPVSPKAPVVVPTVSAAPAASK